MFQFLDFGRRQNLCAGPFFVLDIPTTTATAAASNTKTDETPFCFSPLAMSFLIYAAASLTSFTALVWFLTRKMRAAGVYMDGVSAVQSNTDDDGSLGTCIHVLVTFRGRVTTAEMARKFRTTFIDQPRFSRFKDRMRRRRCLWSYWEPVEDFDVVKHFVAHTKPIAHDAMEAKITSMLSEGLDTSLPPWQMHVFEDYTDADGARRSAMVGKFHHGMGDGFNLMSTILQGCSPREPPVPASKPRSRKGLGMAAKALKLVAAVGKMLLLQDDPPSALKMKTGLKLADRKNVAYRTMPMTVDQVKAAAKAHAARAGVDDRVAVGSSYTINEVLLAAVAGALRSSLEAKAEAEAAAEGKSGKRDDADKAAGIKGLLGHDPLTVMWASLAGSLNQAAKFAARRDAARWGNSSLAAVYTKLPVADAGGPLARLAAVQERTRKLVGSPEPLVANGLMKIFGWLPAAITRVVWPLVAYKTTLSLSNVPGPQWELQWLPDQGEKEGAGNGWPMEEIGFIVPPQHTLGLFMCVFSYNGKLIFTGAADDRIMDAAVLHELIHQRIPDEMDAIVAALGGQ